MYEVAPGAHLLRMAIIHGANASGKTNILRAFVYITCRILLKRNFNLTLRTFCQVFQFLLVHRWLGNQKFQVDLK